MDYSINGHPKNVIFVVTDGMGPSVVTMGRDYLRAVTKNPQASLILDDFPVRGTAIPSCADYRVGDSATSASAMFSGVKINAGAVNWGVDGCPVATLGEALQDMGYAVGVVAKSRITHATPAAMGAHGPWRDDENGIAYQFISYFQPDLLMGGGSRHFVPSNVTGSTRVDNIDLLASARASGYAVIRGRAEFDAWMPRGEKALVFPGDVGGAPSSHLAYEADRDPAIQPSLTEMANKAMDAMEATGKPYFLMVEASFVDMTLHDSDPSAAYREVLDMHHAVEALAARRDPHTLLVVQPDHDTGGAALVVDGDTPAAPSRYYLTYEARGAFACSFRKMAGQIIAGGRGADVIRGVIKNCTVVGADAGVSDVQVQTIQDVQATVWRASGSRPAYLVDSYMAGLYAGVGVSTEGMRLGTFSAFPSTPATDRRPYATHSAVDVGTWAMGPGAAAFGDTHDMFQIGGKLARALGVNLRPRASRLRAELCSGNPLPFALSPPGNATSCSPACVAASYTDAYVGVGVST